jgi:hypothetical protein
MSRVALRLQPTAVFGQDASGLGANASVFVLPFLGPEVLTRGANRAARYEHAAKSGGVFI